MKQMILGIRLVGLVMLGCLVLCTTVRAQGERTAAATNVTQAARERFLAVERFARLSAAQQAAGLPEFYRQQAPYFMSMWIEGILSSYPSNLLHRGASGFPSGDAKVQWARQLAEAAARQTPEQVADLLEIRLWLDVAGRARTVQLLKDHAAAVKGLLAEDLASQELPALQRACTIIGDLRLREYTDQVLAIYLADGPRAEPAHGALVWLSDPATVRPLLAHLEQDQKRIIRLSGLFQGPLVGKPAEPLLVKLLDAPDAEVRYHAASALSTCRDATLAKPIARLAQAAAPRLQSAALQLALRLPEDAFDQVHDDLAPLLDSADDEVSLAAMTCFAQRKDPLAGPPILRRLRQEKLNPGNAVTVMQALNALAGQAFNYNLHQWGPNENARAIARFEAWLRGSQLR